MPHILGRPRDRIASQVNKLHSFPPFSNRPLLCVLVLNAKLKVTSRTVEAGLLSLKQVQGAVVVFVRDEELNAVHAREGGGQAAKVIGLDEIIYGMFVQDSRNHGCLWSRREGLD